jgi:hypothetical protein
MKLPSLRLGAASIAAGSILVLATRLLRRRPSLPALPAPSGAQGHFPPVPVAEKPAPKTFPAPASVEHVPSDLAPDRDPGLGERAVDAFRPDPTAPIPAAEREALRPAPPLESAAKALADSDRAEAI